MDLPSLVCEARSSVLVASCDGVTGHQSHLSREPKTWRLESALQFPGKHYAFENQDMCSYHPAEVTLGPQTWRDIQIGVRTPEVERLIELMVVLGLPKGYQRPLG